MCSLSIWVCGFDVTGVDAGSHKDSIRASPRCYLETDVNDVVMDAAGFKKCSSTAFGLSFRGH